VWFFLEKFLFECQLLFIIPLLPHMVFLKKLQIKFGLHFVLVNFSFEYRIRTNIGEELNFADWRIAMQSPSLNLANIFLL